MITDSQAREVVNLLHKDYQECDITIVKSKLGYLRCIFREVSNLDLDFKHHIRVLRGKTLGNYHSKRNHVQIYLMNIENRIKKEVSPSKYEDMHIVGTIFHEVRHHYQNKYNKLHLKTIERDADRFSARMLDKHWDEVREILERK